MSDDKKQEPKPKGILRKGGQSSREVDRSATFDEMNIIATLHPADKDYGHMKVDEAPTPYSYEYKEEQETELDPNVLAAKLAESIDKPLKSETMKTPSEDDLTPEEEAKRKEFEKKRKAHYNEYYAVLSQKNADKTPDKVDVSVPGSSRSPNLEYCKDIPDCPGHKLKSTVKCDISEAKCKMGAGTQKKNAGSSNK